ncbi:MAG: HaeII family restriction endonuclease [Candidatus Jacksonbacteria bacterium]
MRTNNLAKKALDAVIRKSRVHLYKPIQIAEILHRHRTERSWDLSDLESYRNISKRWRDEVSSLLVGRQSTSSQKYQDNIFEANAMPPALLARLGTINKRGKGFIEAYIYKALEARLSSVRGVENYIKSSSADVFSIRELVALFQTTPGLRRSVDKMYEILVYALFATIVRALKAQVTLEIGNKDEEILKDFERFIKMVLGIDRKQTRLVLPAALYRVGVTNAADRGLDIWANFGPAIQVKHLTLTAELMEDIVDDITADKIVIVCLDTEKEAIESLLKQVGWSERIQEVITINDLDDWYKLCLSKKYHNNLGANLLKDVQREFDAEFPSSREIGPFMAKRGYDKIVLPPDWQIQI